MGQGRHTLRSISDPVYPRSPSAVMLSCGWVLSRRKLSVTECPEEFSKMFTGE